MTLTEAILARAAGKERVEPGEIVEARIDLAMIHENTGVPAIIAFERMGVPRLWDPARVVAIIDHRAPAPDERSAALHRKLRQFCREAGVGTFYEAGAGICHQVLPEKGHIQPGQVVVGTDSHTCTYGALGAFATGIGSTEMAGVFATGKLWFKVPESYLILYEGTPRPGVGAKDVILKTIGQLGADGANYKAVEYAGDYVSHLGTAGRLTMCNMAIEMGAKVGIIAPDDETARYLAPRTKASWQPLRPGAGDEYERVVRIDVSQIEPQIACPHQVDNVQDISAVEGQRVDQVFIGSCTNGRLEDLAAAARVLAGRRVAPGVRLLVIPASREVMQQALAEGVLQVLLDAGAMLCHPNCGPCDGGHEGILAEGEVCLSTANRNFKGRMGKGAEIFLSSPLVAAASAVAGHLTDPRKLGGIGR